MSVVSIPLLSTAAVIAHTHFHWGKVFSPTVLGSGFSMLYNNYSILYEFIWHGQLISGGARPCLQPGETLIDYLWFRIEPHKWRKYVWFDDQATGWFDGSIRRSAEPNVETSLSKTECHLLPMCSLLPCMVGTAVGAWMCAREAMKIALEKSTR